MLDPKRWWIGLPILAALIYFASEAITRNVEIDLSRRAVEALGGADKGAIENPTVVVEGRDVALGGVTLSPQGGAQALAKLRAMDGVRTAVDRLKPLETARPFTLTVTRADRAVKLEGFVPPDGAREKMRAELNRQGLVVVDETRYAAGAPTAFAELAVFAARELAQLDDGVVKLRDDAYSIKGVASPEADFDKVVAAAHNAPHGARAESVVIEPARVSPYVWSAEHRLKLLLLRGFLPDSAARARILGRAQAMAQGDEVSDQMRIALGAPAGDFLGAVEAALTQLQSLTEGKVALKDAALSVEGRGKINVTAFGVAAAAKKDLPQGFEVARVDVAAGPASPYLFSASAREGSLTLTGHAPDEAALKTLREAVARDFSGLSRSEALSVADGAPQDFVRAATAGLSALAQLKEGGLAISDRKVALTGEAGADKIAAISDGLRTALPGGFVSEVQIFPGAGEAPPVPPPPPPAPERAEPKPEAKPQPAPAPQPQPFFKDAGSAVKDAASLQKAIDAQLEKTPLAFGARAEKLGSDGAPALQSLAALLRRAPDATLEIKGHMPGPGIRELNETIAKRRAQSVAQGLVALGFDAAHVEVAGLADPNEDVGRPAIEIVVKSY